MAKKATAIKRFTGYYSLTLRNRGINLVFVKRSVLSPQRGKGKETKKRKKKSAEILDTASPSFALTTCNGWYGTRTRVNFFPLGLRDRTSRMCSFCFYSAGRYTDSVHSVREKRPRVSAARRAGFFTAAAGNRPVFGESGCSLFLSLDRIQRPPTIRSIVILRVRCETGTDQIRRS